jgi:rhodanese-related sulfurtransferase
MGLPVISPKALHERMQAEPMLVYDLNDESRWLAERVPGARHLDHKSIQADDLPTDRDAVMVFYCSNPLCRKAPNAARRAIGLGHRNVYVMSAGISGWLSASLPTDSGTPNPGD